MQHLPETYPQILAEIKTEIRQGQLRAVFSANAHMLALYSQIRKIIKVQHELANGGDKET